MTTDPVRLLAQDDDAFASSLLKAGRDGDAATARARKAAVLGAAAGGAALGGAALLGAKVASKGVWATFTGKWLAVFAIMAGGAGVTAAMLLSGDGGGPANDGDAAAVAAPAETHAAAVGAPLEPRPAAKPSEPAPGSEPVPPSEPAPIQPPAPVGSEPAPTPAIPPPSDPAAKAAAASAPRSGNAAQEPASAGTGAPVAAGSPAAPAPSDAASALAEEVAALRAAREALGRGQAQKCLEAVNAYFARFPKGALSAEARLLRVEAMAASGQRDQAAAQARAMLAANPHSPYAPRLRAIAGESASP